MTDRGPYGGSCNNDTLLWFILVFLLLFYKPYGYCPYACGYEGQS